MLSGNLHDEPDLYVRSSDEDSISGITDTTRSVSSGFVLTRVRHALVPLEHWILNNI